MAIQDDVTIDFTRRRITYTTAFVDDRPPVIYTVNELYSYLQDTFDEPANMIYLVPMTAQTPTQYTLVNGWYMDDESIKAFYGGSIQTTGWVKSGAAGITQLRWQNAPADAPLAGDIGVTLTGGTSTATGVLLAVNATRQVAWVRNTSAAQFANNETVTGTGVDFDTAVISGFQTGETVWANAFSVGSLQAQSEIYVGQEDDYMGGVAYHTATTYARRIEKVDEWWDSDVDFTGSPNLIGGLGHFDILLKTQEAGALIDGGRVAVFARQFSKVYSHFEFTAASSGNFVVPFASTGADLNAQDGPYTAAFDGRTGATLEVGDVLENDTGTLPVGRLRAVVTAVTGGGAATGTVDYYLIGENQPNPTTDRTLVQFVNDDNVAVRGDTTAFDINGAPTIQGPGLAQGITITFADTQVDVDENAVVEQYAATINCNSVALASVYKRVMFLASRGNQDGTVANTQDELLPSAATPNESSEFYRAVGDVIFTYDGGLGTFITEGDYVTNSGVTASGVVVSVTSGATGTCVLTQVKGTFANNDQIARPTEHATNRIDVDGAVTLVTDNTGSPFGSFAGGRWFVARGIVLTNVPSADANNWETVDLAGFRRAPPAVRTITFAGLTAGDRVSLLEVNVAGGADITVTQNSVDTGGEAAGATSVGLDSNVALDVPAAGWMLVRDVSTPDFTTYPLEYSSYSAATVTLRAVSPGDDICDAAGSATVLVDTGIATSGTFGTDGFVKIGMIVRNTTSGGWARVIRRINDNSIETTTLTVGTWATGNAYLLNVVPVAIVDADDAYFPYIFAVALGATVTANVKYVSDTDLIARARFSSPVIGGTRILPFEQRNITLLDANLTVTAIRNDDTIAA